MGLRANTLRVVGAAVAAAAFVVAAASPAFADNASQFVDKTNALRASKGVGTLVVDSRLTSIAQQWAQHMAATQTLSHNPNLASQLPPNWTKYGENVGEGGSVDSIHQAFVNSPHHYANLVDPAFQYIGVGVVTDSHGVLWVVEDFMQTSSGGPAPAPQSPPTTQRPAPRVTLPPPAPVAPPSVTVAPVPTTAAPKPAGSSLSQIVAELKGLKADS